MIKAAFFDIDGTLLTSNAEVLPSTLNAIEKLHQNGIICCIASGRGPKRIKSLIGDIPMDVYILYNGQIVFSHDTGIYEHYFSKETLEKLATFGDQENRQLVFGGRKDFYGSRSMRMGQRRLIKQLYHYLPDKLSVKDLEKILEKWQILPKNDHKFMNLPIFSQPIYQCVLLSPESETNRLVHMFPECHFTRSNPYSVDIIPKGGSKIEGIKKALQHYGIKQEETIAFGDSWNDTEMLREVGIGVAMGNSSEDIKELADYVTDTNDNDGIMKALKNLKIIR